MECSRGVPPPPVPELVVDLSQVEAFEVGALRALLWARRHCLVRGLRIAVVLPPTGVIRPHETMLLQELFGASHRAAHNGADASPRITRAIVKTCGWACHATC
ncbi:STAS domain-containing protein [Nocardioides pakistanensis]